MDTNALGRGLEAVGKNLGTVANYQAEQQRFDAQQKILDRREQANQQFRAYLEERQMQNANEQHGLDRNLQAEHFDRTEDFNNKRLTIEQQRADTQDKRVQQQMSMDEKRIGLEGERINVERDRVAATKEGSADYKRAQAIGGQMKNIGATITGARKQMQSEIAGAMKSGDWMLKPQSEQDSILNAIKSKYQPVIASAQSKYDQYASKFEELTGVQDAGSDYQQQPGGDDLGGETDTPDTATTSAEAAPVGGAGQSSTVGNDAPPPSYPNAKKAPDGNWYIPDPTRPGKYRMVNK